jgi:hypothetical protein
VKNEFFFRGMALVFRINKFFFRGLAPDLGVFTKGMFLQEYCIRFETFYKMNTSSGKKYRILELIIFFFREIASDLRICTT